MKSIVSKAQYFARSVAKFPFHQSRLCPNCGGTPAVKRDSKYLFASLYRCAACGLQYRSPTDSETFSNRFYNFKYVEGTTTECPALYNLPTLKSRLFCGTEQDFSAYISFLDRYEIRPPMRLLDFGCSWGYGSYQFAEAGFDTYSFEIAIDRRNYGIDNLGVRHIDDVFDIAPGHALFETFDCFFSAHVLEHVPSPSKVIDLAWNCLKPGGAFVAFTPNGCEAFRRNQPQKSRNMWGEVHPNFLDDVFYEQQFANSRREIADRDGGDVMQNYELGLIAWKDAGKGRF